MLSGPQRDGRLSCTWKVRACALLPSTPWKWTLVGWRGRVGSVGNYINGHSSRTASHTSLNSAACPAERPSTACLASRPQSPQRPSGNAGKWIFFLPTEGDEIIIHTSFLRTTESLAANMRPPAFVLTQVRET